jgi:hypothetical protein
VANTAFVIEAAHVVVVRCIGRSVPAGAEPLPSPRARTP